MANTVSELLSGAALLGRALSMITKRPRLFVLGAIPPLITSMIFVGVLVALLLQIERIVGALTPFADAWSDGLATLARAVVGVALVAGAVLIMVISFTALTLALGSPLYDKISESVERELGSTGPAYDEPAGQGVVRAVRQSAGLILVSMVVAGVLFFLGFIPVVGQTVVPVVSAAFGGWVLAIELIGSTFDRRGLLQIADRRAAMRRRRARVLGLAVPTFLLLSIPFAGAVVFPVATAAGTILARDLLRENTTPGQV